MTGSPTAKPSSQQATPPREGDKQLLTPGVSTCSGQEEAPQALKLPIPQPTISTFKSDGIYTKTQHSLTTLSVLRQPGLVNFTGPFILLYHSPRHLSHP